MTVQSIVINTSEHTPRSAVRFDPLQALISVSAQPAIIDIIIGNEPLGIHLVLKSG